MVQQVIDLGELPGGAGGDTNRSANVKCNENFTELYNQASELDETRASNGVNSDITSITGLTTALSVEQGGTGAKNGQDACRNIGAMRLSANNQSAGTTLKNGQMPGIAGLGTDRIGDGPLSLDNDGNTQASCVMTFHRGGSFACFFGMDVDNRLKIGGGSFGSVAFSIYHEGNTTRTSDGTLKAV